MLRPRSLELLPLRAARTRGPWGRAYPRRRGLLGPGVAKRRADELFDDAIAALDVFGDQAAALTELTALIRRRQN